MVSKGSEEEVKIALRFLQGIILYLDGDSFPGDLPDPGIQPGSPALQADSLPAGLPGFSADTKNK